MRLTIPKLRTWHLMGIVAASAALFSVMQFRWSVEDPGYAMMRRLRSLDAVERAKAADGLKFLRPRDRRGSYARRDQAALAAVLAALGDPAFEVRWRAVNALHWCAMVPKLAPQPL